MRRTDYKIFKILNQIISLTVGTLGILLFAFVGMLRYTMIASIDKVFGKNKIFNFVDKYTMEFIWIIYRWMQFGFDIRPTFNRIPDLHTPMIYISNHHSFADGWALSKLRTFFVAKSDVRDELPLLGKLLKYVEKSTIFVTYERGCKDSGKIVKEKILDLIKNRKQNILVYPEGTTQRCGNKILPFKKGLFDMAYTNKIPIQPLSLHYTKQVGVDKTEKVTIRHILAITDLDVICDFGDVLLPLDEESFEDYFERAQNSINSEMYHLG